MERPNSASHYVPPVAAPEKRFVQQNANSGTTTNWQATEKTSFESALNRIRDRNVREENTVDRTETDFPDMKADDALIDEFAPDELDTMTEEVAESVEGEIDANPQAMSSASVSSAFGSGSSSTQLLDMSMNALEVSSGAMGDMGSTEAIGSAAPGTAASSARGSTLTAESLGQMMSRLERAPGAHNGQWQFGVLNEQAGVTALQLQRSANGGWRVNVSFNETSQVDEKRHAEELKTALMNEGHDVDSVEISKLNASFTPVDD